MAQNSKVKVIGLGGFGLAAVSEMAGRVVGPEFLGLSNKHDLINDSDLSHKILLGGGVTTNHSPELGKRRVTESSEEIKKAIAGYDVVVIITALGYGTGTGGAPLIASMAKEMGIFTMVICTMPFSFEGTNRDAVAKAGLFQLKAICDSVIVISNQKLVKGITKPQDGLDEKLGEVRKLARYIVSSLSNVIYSSTSSGRDGLECFKSLYTSGKDTYFGCGAVLGESQAVTAVRHAAKSDLLQASLSSSQRVLVTIDYVGDLAPSTLNLIYDEVYNITGSDAEIIYTRSVNPEAAGILFISLFATGDGAKEEKISSEFDKLKDAINPNNFM